MSTFERPCIKLCHFASCNRISLPATALRSCFYRCHSQASSFTSEKLCNAHCSFSVDCSGQCSVAGSFVLPPFAPPSQDTPLPPLTGENRGFYCPAPTCRHDCCRVYFSRAMTQVPDFQAVGAVSSGSSSEDEVRITIRGAIASKHSFLHFSGRAHIHHSRELLGMCMFDSECS